jgi:hypothetical protein
MREGTTLENSPLDSGWRALAIREFANMLAGNGEITFVYDKSLKTKSSIE